MKKTPLYDWHVAAGAKMVEFAGYLMPVQYRGIIEEHKKVRSSVGLFDVSHMGEFTFYGPEALAFLQKMTINDVGRLAVGQAQYSAMCYDHGGIVDDLIVYRHEDHYLMVVNAANLEKDWQWLQEHAMPGVELRNESDDTALMALQGRHAEKVLQPLTDLDLSGIKFYWFAIGRVAGVEAMVSRTGYTGEDGFEIAVAANDAVKVWEAMMESGKPYEIEPVGLGARDTLRMEMKYCLYGNDIDETTNPLEAGLGWITKLEKGDFIGAGALLRVKAEGIKRKLVGMELEDRNIARHGYPIFKDGEEVGVITSGTFSPSLNRPIAIGYVAAPHHEIGTELTVKIRQRDAAATVVKTPFYQRPY
ncbi:MAG: glycine cleavage system aminomethyltransferase GcvT [candidate division KSB1 bacterium]|nr:glycine cleavage system aminomethyltransferase GcvT [candidate division KSB1 bacterium]MDQ7066444.1 glycine cleavage system aminomethyltransferase GcvT [candidate division KSB1 bacterium]